MRLARGAMRALRSHVCESDCSTRSPLTKLRLSSHSTVHPPAGLRFVLTGSCFATITIRFDARDPRRDPRGVEFGVDWVESGDEDDDEGPAALMVAFAASAGVLLVAPSPPTGRGDGSGVGSW